MLKNTIISNPVIAEHLEHCDQKDQTAATAAHCAVQLQRARQLCSGGIVWLHDKISRITI